MIQRPQLRKGPCFFAIHSRIPCATWYHKTLGNIKRFGVSLPSGSLQQAPLDSWGGKGPLAVSAPTSCLIKVRVALRMKILLLLQVLVPVLDCHPVSPDYLDGPCWSHCRVPMPFLYWRVTNWSR